MTRRLYLIRHAKSSWSDPLASDFDRKLNKRGKRDAPFMGKRMHEYSVMPQAIHCSPARRARKTAFAIAKEIGFPKEKIHLNEKLYTFSASDLLFELKQIEETETIIFLVGHNNAITDLAVSLTGEYIDNVPTAGIVGIDFSCKTWAEVSQGTGKFLFFDYPKKHGDRG